MWRFAAIMMATLFCVGANAAEFPSRPIKIIVPFAPGGGIDTGARIMGHALSQDLGQPVIVENHPGANGVIAFNAVKNAPADGYTLWFSAASTQTAVTVREFPENFLTAMTPVAPTARTEFVLFVNGAMPVHSVGDLIAYAKANPGKLNYASQTASTTLAMEMLKAKAGIDIVGIPYKGSSQAGTALITNEIQAVFDSPTVLAQYEQDGKVHALLTTGPERSKVFPNAPTAAEAGFPYLQIGLSNAFWAKAGTPPDVIAKLNGAINAALTKPDIQQALTGVGWQAVNGTAADLGKAVRAEMDFWAEAAGLANYQP